MTTQFKFQDGWLLADVTCEKCHIHHGTWVELTQPLGKAMLSLIEPLYAAGKFTTTGEFTCHNCPEKSC